MGTGLKAVAELHFAYWHCLGIDCEAISVPVRLSRVEDFHG